MKNRLRGISAMVAVVILGVVGCRAVATVAVVSSAVVVGTVGYVGYGVYKCGEAVVSGVKYVGSSVTGAAKKGHKAVVISRGTLKVKSEHPITVLYPAAKTVMDRAQFRGVFGSHDALEGTIRAKTASNESVLVSFKLLEKNLTAIEIRIGDGNLKQSEYIYDQILAEIASDAAPEAPKAGGDQS